MGVTGDERTRVRWPKCGFDWQRQDLCEKQGNERVGDWLWELEVQGRHLKGEIAEVKGIQTPEAVSRVDILLLGLAWTVISSWALITNIGELTFPADRIDMTPWAQTACLPKFPALTSWPPGLTDSRPIDWRRTINTTTVSGQSTPTAVDRNSPWLDWQMLWCQRS